VVLELGTGRPPSTHRPVPETTLDWTAIPASDVMLLVETEMFDVTNRLELRSDGMYSTGEPVL